MRPTSVSPRRLLGGLAVVLASSLPAPAAPDGRGSVLLTAEEALELVFPECRVERETVYLTREQKERASELADERIETGLVYVYSAFREGEGGDELAGYAFFDTHEVRTKRETVMIAVDPDARVRRVEVLAFAEPREYLPRGKWYGQFAGRRLDDKLRIPDDIHGVAGATLTARATLVAVRRTLALHHVVHGTRPTPPPPPGDSRSPAGKP
jgi:hypothetical protein